MLHGSKMVRTFVLLINAVNKNNIMQPSSNLNGKTKEEIEMMAFNIAADQFIKHGNQAPSFHNCNELRCLVGGRYQSFPELSAFVVEAYNKVLASLILKNQ